MAYQYPKRPECSIDFGQTRQTRFFSFSSESVSDGHPDKLADQISDAILDLYLTRDPHAKVAVECLVACDLVVIAGEINTSSEALHEANVSCIPDLIRQVIRDVGYDSTFPGIDPARCEIKLHLNRQSEDIHRGVQRPGGVLGAGDQGMMFGYACDDTPELMPLPISLAHALVLRHKQLRQSGEIPWLRPDAKSQVTVRYEDHDPIAVEAVVFSAQHTSDVDIETVRETLKEAIIKQVIPASMMCKNMKIFINPTGRFVIGGPQADAGLTGRKIIVDTYGGFCPHGGGAFSGKDPSKVDRSAAYAARNVAKNIIAAKLARRCTVQIAYAIGIAEPVSLMIDTHGTGNFSDRVLEEAVRKVFDLTPAGIIQALNLRRPIYAATSVFGHFGRIAPEFTWERTDRVDDLTNVLSGTGAYW